MSFSWKVLWNQLAAQNQLEWILIKRFLGKKIHEIDWLIKSFSRNIFQVRVKLLLSQFSETGWEWIIEYLFIPHARIYLPIMTSNAIVSAHVPINTIEKWIKVKIGVWSNSNRNAKFTVLSNSWRN